MSQIGRGGAPGLRETTIFVRGPFRMRIYGVSSRSARFGAATQESLRIYAAFLDFCEIYAFFSCRMAPRVFDDSLVDSHNFGFHGIIICRVLRCFCRISALWKAFSTLFVALAAFSAFFWGPLFHRFHRKIKICHVFFRSNCVSA